jgi:hypothetical protein
MSPLQKRILFWLPRVLTIAFAFFLSIFALDVFSEGLGFWQTALALTMHLIPTFLVVAILLAAWRWEWTGAVLFAAAGILYAVKALPRHPSWFLGISVPLLIVAGLFLLDWVKRAELRPTRR